MAWFKGGFNGGFSDGLVVNNADGLVEDVIREKVDGFPDSFVDGGCAGSIRSLFAEKLEQTMS